MTLAELRDELWETTGEQDALLPVNDTDGKLNRWINRAYKRIMFWRFADGTQIRFPCTEGVLFFQTKIVTGLITAGTASIVTLDVSAGANEDQYNGWVIDIGGVRRLIVDYDAGRNATLHEDLGAAPTIGTAYTMYKQFMRLSESTDVGASENIVCSPVNSIMAIRKITNIKRFWDLTPQERTDTFARNFLSPAFPQQYGRRGNDIMFDWPSLEAEWYRMEYVRNPPDLTADDQLFETPAYFDQGILLGAIWSVLVWQQDNDEAYARKRDLQEFMITAKQQGEMEYERESGQAEVEL